MCLYKILLRCSGLVGNVDLIFRIECEIFGQDNVSLHSKIILTIRYCQNVCFE